MSARGGTLLRVWLEHFTIIVDDYDRAIEFFTGALGSELAAEPYGRVAVFLDVAGNRWDLLGPVP
jgi:catechol 2,3-dioxygenase-like lactoylglutathione lyase family enzyme